MLISCTCFAQAQCPKPELKAYYKHKALDQKGTKLPTEITIKTEAVQTCAAKHSYQIQGGTIYLVSGSFPKQSKKFTGASIDVKDWVKLYKPGERIVIEITDANKVLEDGSIHPVKEQLTMVIGLQ